MNLVEEQRKTPLGLVNEIFAKQEFVCPTEDPVEEKEAIIGTLTDYEKAIALAANIVRDRHNKVVDDQKIKPESEIILQLMLDKKTYNLLNDLLWVSVKTRLGRAALDPDNIGFRKDWKIVSFSMATEVFFGI
jgi:hypothetical protein